MSENKTLWTPGPWEPVTDAQGVCGLMTQKGPRKVAVAWFSSTFTPTHGYVDERDEPLGRPTREANARLIAAAPTVVERYLTKLARWADIAERNPGFRDEHEVYSTATSDAEVTWTLGELKEARALLASIRGESA